MDKNQTAVEWLLTELQAKFPNEMYAMYNSNQLEFESIVSDAKETNKQQIIDAWRDCDYLNSEQYYNETYGKEGGEG